MPYIGVPGSNFKVKLRTAMKEVRSVLSEYRGELNVTEEEKLRDIESTLAMLIKAQINREKRKYR